MRRLREAWRDAALSVWSESAAFQETVGWCEWHRRRLLYFWRLL